MEKGQACCFTGPRLQNLPFGSDEFHPACVRMKERIRQEILRLFIEGNVTHFITGMASGVEQICAEIVLELKKTCPQLTLECAIPYEEQAAKWTERERDRYFTILASCDTETLLQTGYSRNCMKRKKEYLVGHSDFVLAVWDGIARNGTGKTIRYARKQGRGIAIIHAKTLEITREQKINTAG